MYSVEEENQLCAVHPSLLRRPCVLLIHAKVTKTLISFMKLSKLTAKHMDEKSGKDKKQLWVVSKNENLSKLAIYNSNTLLTISSILWPTEKLFRSLQSTN